MDKGGILHSSHPSIKNPSRSSTEGRGESSRTPCISINRTNRDDERVIMISNGAGFYLDLIGWARSRDVIIRGITREEA